MVALESLPAPKLSISLSPRLGISPERRRKKPKARNRTRLSKLRRLRKHPSLRFCPGVRTEVRSSSWRLDGELLWEFHSYQGFQHTSGSSPWWCRPRWVGISASGGTTRPSRSNRALHAFDEEMLADLTSSAGDFALCGRSCIQASFSGSTTSMWGIEGLGSTPREARIEFASSWADDSVFSDDWQNSSLISDETPCPVAGKKGEWKEMRCFHLTEVQIWSGCYRIINRVKLKAYGFLASWRSAIRKSVEFLDLPFLCIRKDMTFGSKKETSIYHVN